MSKRETVTIEGLTELKQALRQLPQELTHKVLKGALTDGAHEIEHEAERRAPILKTPDPRRKPGTLRRRMSSIGLRTAVRPYQATVLVYPRPLSRGKVTAFKRSTGKGASDNPDDPFYWRFVEYGTRFMAAIPFLRPAFEAKKYAALEKVRAALKLRIEKAAAKLAWRKKL